MWLCQQCGETIEDSFEVCWKCGTARDGTQDPDFRAEPTDPAVPDPRPEPEAGSRGDDLLAAHRMKPKAPPWLVIRRLAVIGVIDLATWILIKTIGPLDLFGWPRSLAELLSELLGGLLPVLIFSQAALLGFWLGMGKGSLLVRFFCVCVGVGLLGSLLLDTLGVPPSRIAALGWPAEVPHSPLLLGLFVFTFIQAIVFLGFRIAGFRLEPSGAIPGETDSPAAPGFRLQYSIWNIIEWTICVAILLTLYKVLVLLNSLNVYSNYRMLYHLIPYLIPYSVIALASAWATLRTRRLWPWLGVIGVSSLLLVTIGGFIVLFGAWLYTLLTLWMFWLLDASGYRIVRVGSVTFPMIKLWALFHIVVGGLGLLTGLIPALVFASFYGVSVIRLLVRLGPLMVAGLLYAFSGFLLWRSSNKVSGKLVLFQGLTLIFAIMHLLIVGMRHHWIYQVPADAVLLMLFELAYLWVCWRKGRELTSG